jgi:hypothetical protein
LADSRPPRRGSRRTVARDRSLTKALSQAERAHDSRAIGLAHYELRLCYRQEGEMAIVREHITQAASALHAPATGAISPWSTRYRASPSPRKGVSTKHGRAAQAETARRHRRGL